MTDECPFCGSSLIEFMAYEEEGSGKQVPIYGCNFCGSTFRHGFVLDEDEDD